MPTDFTTDTRMAPDVAKAFNAGARAGLMRALNLLWWNVHCSDATHRRECEAAYHQLAGMIDAEFPGEDDTDAAE